VIEDIWKEQFCLQEYVSREFVKIDSDFVKIASNKEYQLNNVKFFR